MEIKMEQRILKDVGNQATIEVCTVYYALGFNCVWNDGKDLNLIPQKKDPSSGCLKRSDNENTNNLIISHAGGN